MSQPPVSDFDKWVAGLDSGEPVSAGARVLHVLAKGIYPIDLTSIPLDRRHDVVQQIRELILRASVPTNDTALTG